MRECRTIEQRLFSAECPECQQRVELKRKPPLLQLTQCPHCEEILIVTDNDPIEFCEALMFAFEYYEA